MQLLVNEKFDQERALYGVSSVHLVGCSFDGEADGESALKESDNIKAEKCLFNLRYPFWHDVGIEISESEMTSLCRAALWYSKEINIKNTAIHGIKALRECSDIVIENSNINSAEFGWFSKNIKLFNSDICGEYFMLKAENLNFADVKFLGKYSFQYIKNANFENCVFETKDAFWHAKDVVVKNCLVKGEYLAWYSENVTFENCIIYGTQPLCYCKGLKLIDCEMYDADLAFELSEVEATLKTSVASIKNPKKGKISLPSECEIIKDDLSCACEIDFNKN